MTYPKTPRPKAHPLKAEMHALIDRVHRIERKAVAHYRKHYANWAATAEKRGHPNPQTYPIVKQRKRREAIRKAHPRAAHDLMKRYGIDREGVSPIGSPWQNRQ